MSNSKPDTVDRISGVESADPDAVHTNLFTHQKNLGLLMLRASDSSTELQRRLQELLGLSLPQTLSSYSLESSGGALCIRWLAPDAWLLSGPLEAIPQIESRLRSEQADVTVDTPAHIAIIDVSGGYRCFHLQGRHCNTLLKKSTAYDVHPVNFPPGKVVNTTFAKTQVTLRCVAVDHVEIIVRLSYADYLIQWIRRAAQDLPLTVSV